MSNMEESTSDASMDDQVEAILSDHYDNAESDESGEQIESSGPGEQEQPQSTEGDSFTDINPADLPESLQPIYKSLQADYTRKQQATAEAQRQYAALDQYGGVDAANQALAFVHRLNSDPGFAQEIHAHLSQSLQQAGYSPEAADEEALNQVGDFMDEYEDDEWYEDDDYEVPQPRQPTVDPQVTARLAQMENRFKQLDEQEQVNQTASYIADQERAILEINPHWNNDQDLDMVYALAYSRGGNLIEGAALYEEMQNKTVSRYLTNKKGVRIPQEPGQTIGGEEEERTFERLDDPDIDKIVERRISELSAL